MPLPFSILSTERRDRLNSVKDAQYHLDMARWAGSTISNWMLTEYYWRIWLNWQFYQGQQWIYSDDVTIFLQDSDGQARGRRRVTDNFIKPYVHKLIDEGRKMSLDFKAKSVGDRVINRREQELLNIKGARMVANLFPNLESSIKKQKGHMGKDMDDTEEIFRNIWNDQYESTVNNLVKYVTEQNRLDTVIRNFRDKELAVTGMAVVREIARRNELIIKPISSENFFFDPGALYPDATDAEYMGDTEFAMPTDLYEHYDLSKSERERIEKATKYIPTTSPIYMPMPYAYAYQPGRVCKVNVEWRDTEKQEWGFVRDPFGYEWLTRVYPNNEEGKYHYSDLIEPESDRNKAFMKGKKKTSLNIEVLRYCEFTPSEAISSGKNQDIVYEYGIVPYQETYCQNPTISEFTYKVQMLDYHDGFISTPLDDLIETQRVLNRAMSLAEYRMETVGGANIAVDIKAASGGDMNVEELERRTQRGLPLMLDGTRLGGLQNAVIPYGQNVEGNIMGFVAYRNALKQEADARTGVFSPSVREGKKVLLGEEQESASLHGNYLNCIEAHHLQIIQGIANRGRKVYADSPRRLAIAVGDEGAKEIVITKDMLLEDFRIFVNRTDNEAMSKEKGIAVLTDWYKNALIAKRDWADNVGRATLDDLPKIAREAYIREQTAQKAQAEQAKEQKTVQTMQAIGNQEQVQNEMQKQQLSDKEEADKDRHGKETQIILRTHGQLERDKQKAQLKKEELVLKAELEKNLKEQEKS